MPTLPLITTNVFRLVVAGIGETGHFSRCSGLELSFDVYEYREGGNNDFVHHLPGRIHYPNLVLSFGLTKDEALFKWFWATHTKAERKEITLTLGSEPENRTWTFADAFPVRWSGPQLAADGRGVATETLEIAHTGLKLA
jgi:phage tail-like protein